MEVEMPDVKKYYQEYISSPDGAAMYHAFKTILYGEEDVLPEVLYNIIKSDILALKKSPINILDVGGGDGRRLRLLTDRMKADKLKWKALLIDPSEALIDLCFKEWGTNRSIDIYHGKLENCYVPQKFELILLLHSIFCLNRFTYLSRVKQMLSNDGLVVIQSNKDDSFLAGLKKITDARFQSNSVRLEIDIVKSDLVKAGFTLTEHDVSFTSSEVVRDTQLTEKGQQVLQWIALMPLKDIPSEIVEEATAYFLKHCADGSFVEQEQIIVVS